QTEVTGIREGDEALSRTGKPAEEAKHDGNVELQALDALRHELLAVGKSRLVVLLERVSRHRGEHIHDERCADDVQHRDDKTPRDVRNHGIKYLGIRWNDDGGVPAELSLAESGLDGALVI